MFVIEFLFCATTALRHGGTFFKTGFLSTSDAQL